MDFHSALVTLSVWLVPPTVTGPTMSWSYAQTAAKRPPRGAEIAGIDYVKISGSS